MIIDIKDCESKIQSMRKLAKENESLFSIINQADNLAKLTAITFLVEIKSMKANIAFSKSKFVKILKYIEQAETGVHIINGLSIEEVVALKYVNYVKQIIRLNESIYLEKNSILELLSCALFGEYFIEKMLVFKSYDGFIEYINKYGSEECGRLMIDSLLYLVYFSTRHERQKHITEGEDLMAYCDQVIQKYNKNMGLSKSSLLNKTIKQIKALSTKNEKWFIFSIGYLFIFVLTIYKACVRYDDYGNIINIYSVFVIFLLLAYIGAARISSKNNQMY